MLLKGVANRGFRASDRWSRWWSRGPAACRSETNTLFGGAMRTVKGFAIIAMWLVALCTMGMAVTACGGAAVVENGTDASGGDATAAADGGLLQGDGGVSF